MILNGHDLYEGRGDSKKYRVVKLKEGDKIKFLFDDELLPLCGLKNIKKGKYFVKEVRKSFIGEGMIYSLFSDRKNAKYEFPINTIVIDKGIELELIIEIN